MLLQKSNGTFYLAIWDERTSTSTTSGLLSKKPALPIIRELREILAAHSVGHYLTFLTGRAGEPFTGVAFTNWFRDRCAEAGLPRGLVAHGLRRAAAADSRKRVAVLAK